MHFDTSKLKKYVKGPNDWTQTNADHDLLINTFKEHEIELGEWGVHHECEQEGCTATNRQGVFFTFADNYPDHSQVFDLKRAILAFPFVRDHEEQLKTLYVSWCPNCGAYEFEFKT